jgi:hypothetical protein
MPFSKDALTELLAEIDAGRDVKYRYHKSVFAPHAHISHAACNGSLDAAKALHEMVLPDFSWSVSKYDRAYISKHTDPNDITTWIEVSARSENPARAWLIAILEALVLDA